MQDLRVTRTANFTGATVTGLNNGLGLMGKGRVFYVDNTSGSDGYGVQSQNPNYPMLTISGAMDLCTASVGDVVCVMQNSPSTATTGEVWPIAMDVAGVLLMGLYSRGGRISDSGFGSTPTNTNCIDIAANFLAIENLYLQVTTGTTGDVIGGLTASRYGLAVRNCWIGLQNTTRYGIYAQTWDMPYLLVEDNDFSAPNVAGMTHAIYLSGNATFGEIRRNTFYSCSSYALNMGGAQAVTVTDNDFRLYSDTKGFAIYAPATTNHCYFARNYAQHGLADTSANPYLDLATDGKNAWVMNYKGDDVTYPATS